MRTLCLSILLLSCLALSSCGGESEAPEQSAPAVEPEPAAEQPTPKPVQQAPLSKGPKYVRVAPDQVDATRRATAEKFARTYMEQRRAGRFEELGPEATPKMRQGLTPDKERKAYAELKEWLGEYESLEYAEAWTGSDAGSTIFRFRGKFAKDENAEIRVVLDREGLISGFWIKPWRDSLEPPRPIRIPEDKVDAAGRAKAEQLARQILERHKAGKFEPLGDIATPELRAKYTPDGQRASHASIAPQIGEFKSLAYEQTWKIEGDDQTIYRFRGDFTMGRPEVRVVLDAEGLLSGLWIRPWRDTLN